ncbi:hypothetical protein CMI37_12565 [Candidatus Pacearchaeota archaeon]|nr:hypothetical protein [Candidatus Pacearchaeota archaeon]|tara:strand:- start:526 stop:801 length:276 start_codon:yes stop_codon:yes gene_type:complete
MRAIRLNDENYGPRTTLGGGEVRDVMPWPDAVAYVMEGDTLEEPGRFGILYHLPEDCPRCGDDSPDRWKAHVDWLGSSLEKAFGDGVTVVE